jgi:glyoxylase-like metal-dependent hydrolase (beta-lactamase superfamily II)
MAIRSPGSDGQITRERREGHVMRRVQLFGTGLLVSALAWPVVAQQTDARGGLRVLPVRGNVFLLSGGGSNIVASVGRDGVLLVDSGSEAKSSQVLAAIEDLSRRVTAFGVPQRSCVGLAQGCSWWQGSTFLSTTSAPPAPRPIAGIINTSFDPDHMGGNAAIAAASLKFGARLAPGAWIIAHENATLKQGKPIAAASAGLPTESYFGDEKKLNFFNGEGVLIRHQPAAHTDGDSTVQFRESEVLAVGDVLDMTHYPIIDLERGGSIQGIVDSLNWILDISVVEHMMEGGTIVIPGHGRMTDSADVAYYRDMMTIIRDRVQTMIKRGMTLEQVKTARVTKDYDPRFGRNPAWTPDMFVEAVYKSLSARK